MSPDSQALVAGSSHTNEQRHVAQTSLASQVQVPAQANEPLASAADCENTTDKQQTSPTTQSVIHAHAEPQTVISTASGQVQSDLDGPELDKLDETPYGGSLRRPFNCTVSCGSGLLVLPG